jgi:Tol biopolymer transport system component
LAGGELRKLVLAGGTVQRVCALPRPGLSGGTWSEAGTIVFSSGGASATLYQVPAAGGEATPLTTLDTSRGETGHFWPQFLPDGERLLFGVSSQQDANSGLFATSLGAASERRRLLPDTTRFVYAPPDRLLTVREGVLSVRPFDPRGLRARGEPVPIASNVATWAVVPGWGWFSASASGRLAWLSGRDSQLRLAWFDREGKLLGTLGEPAKYSQLALSPDGRRVAVEVEDAEGRFDIWLIDVARNVASRLTTDTADEREPTWSPDGRELVFSSDANGDQNLMHKELQGSEPAAPLPGGIGTTPGERDIPEHWSRAGNTLLYLTLGKERTFWALPMDGKGKPERLLAGQFNLDEPHLSPDGHWLAYVSTESGRFEVYVEPFRRRGERLRVSNNGGGQPRWRGDGKELFYLSLDGGIVSVSVQSGAAGLELGNPTTLVAADRLRAVAQSADYDDWDVTPDGQRFLVKVPETPNERQQIHVLLNWTSLLPR